jgi:histidyl-tRNA synthetase
MKIQKCKGMRDMFPRELDRFRLISEVFRDSCLKWGYDEIKTPTLEYLHLFTSAGTLTPGMLNKVYSFLDWDGWSGERVVLRPDATIPVARMYIENMTDGELAKLFYIANIFMFEETGKKEREKWQCGAELIGAGSSLADIELIVLALETLQKLGLQGIELKLSHAGIMRGILQQAGMAPEEQSRVLDRILDGDTSGLSEIKTHIPGLASLLALKGKSSGFVKNLAAVILKDLPGLKPQFDDFFRIADSLSSLGYEYEIDITSARGFEYYTGIIFQLFSGDDKVGGGGRYDDLIPAMGGKNTPASGFGLNIDRLMQLMPPAPPDQKPKTRIIVNVQPDALNNGFTTAGALREAGYIAELMLNEKAPSDVVWRLDIQNNTPQFTLTEPLKNKQYKLGTLAEVLAKLHHHR